MLEGIPSDMAGTPEELSVVEYLLLDMTAPNALLPLTRIYSTPWFEKVGEKKYHGW